MSKSEGKKIGIKFTEPLTNVAGPDVILPSIPGLQFWLDVAQINAQNGSKVFSFKEASPNEYDIVIPSNYAPTYIEGGLGGLASLYFNNSYIDVPIEVVEGRDVLEIHAVILPGGSSDYQQLFYVLDNINSSSIWQWRINPETNAMLIGGTSKRGGGWVGVSGSANDLAMSSVGAYIEYKDKKYGLFKNGQLDVSGDFSTGGTSTPIGDLTARIGIRSPLLNQDYKGYMSEMLIFDRRLSDIERASLYDYFDDKYSGKSAGFTITGKEYQWLDGANSPLGEMDKGYGYPKAWVSGDVNFETLNSESIGIDENGFLELIQIDDMYVQNGEGHFPPISLEKFFKYYGSDLHTVFTLPDECSLKLLFGLSDSFIEEPISFEEIDFEDFIDSGVGTEQIETVGGVASANSSHSSYPIGNAFIDDETYWRTYSSYTTNWIQYDFGKGNEKLITSASFYNNNSTVVDFIFQASNDGTNWVDLASGNSSFQQEYMCTFENKKKYRFYRLYVSRDSSFTFYMRKIKFFKEKYLGTANFEIPGIEQGVDLSDKYLWMKVNMSSDILQESSPSLQLLTMDIFNADHNGPLVEKEYAVKTAESYPAPILWRDTFEEGIYDDVVFLGKKLILSSAATGDPVDIPILIGNSGTSTSSSMPFKTYYYKNKVQYILTSEELVSFEILPAAQLLGLTLKASASSNKELVDFRIRLKEIENETLSAWETLGLTLVYGPVTIPSSTVVANAEVKFDFIEPFVYKGGNLLIEVSRDGTSGTNAGGMYTRTGLSSGKMLGGYVDSGASFPFDSMTIRETLTYVLDTTLTVRGTEFLSSGMYETEEIMLEKEMRLRWKANIPEDTELTVQYSYTENVWEDIEEGEILSDGAVKLRVLLSTEDVLVSPELYELWLEEPEAPADELLITMLDEFKNVQGDIIVKYNQTLGGISGRGGMVVNFEKQFKPTGLKEGLTRTGGAFGTHEFIHASIGGNVELIKIEQVPTYSFENIEVGIGGNIELIHVDDLNP